MEDLRKTIKRSSATETENSPDTRTDRDGHMDRQTKMGRWRERHTETDTH
jgi:hypothetical protein